MALHITWFAGSDKRTGQCYGRVISSESLSVSGSNATSAAAPEAATIAHCVAGEAVYVSNKGTSPTASATSGVKLNAAGDVIDLEVNPGDKIAATTA